MKNKAIKGVLVLLLTINALLLSDCTKNEQNIELKIISDCESNICHIELSEVTVLTTSNMLGKINKHVIHKTSLTNSNDNINWSITGGSYAKAQQMTDANLPGCAGGNDCNANSNPTGYVFPTGASIYAISVTGVVTLSNGRTQQVNQSGLVDIEASGIKTQITFTGGDYSNIAASGTASNSGISWVNNQANPGIITFTCPSGLAIPTNTVAPVTYLTNITMQNPNQAGSTKAIEIQISNGNIGDDYANYASTYVDYMNNVNGYLVVGCVPEAGVDGYTQS